jgi:hypothetical protein
VSRLTASLHHWTGRHLIDTGLPPAEQARRLFSAPFALLSHDTAADPVFNYANRTALELWEMSWEAFTALPSRGSAEPMERDARARLLAQVRERGFVDGPAGVRVSSAGRRFLIENAVIWNLLDESGEHYGQAAMVSRWRFLPGSAAC